MASKPKPAEEVKVDRPVGVPREIAIADIFITNKNLRTEFNTPEDAELVESVRQKGVLEPLLVRDNSKWRSKGDKKRDYDLMAGERRLRAATIAGLTRVPCMVYDVDDETAYEIMVLENLQRKDLHELDYAKGFHEMMKRGYTVEKLAAQLGKGETFVREMLSFDNLPANAEHAFRNGAIAKSHAVLIGTIPDEKKREEYAKIVITGKGNVGGHWYHGDEAMSVRKAKELKEEHYMKDLSKAPFPLDQQLDKSWPYSCLTCPHYNGNTPEARQGKRPNICLNPTHYAEMVQLNAQARMKAAEDSGAIVMSSAEVNKNFHSYYSDNYDLKYDSKYVDLNKSFTDYAKKGFPSVQWSRVAKAAGIEAVIAVTPNGKEHRLGEKAKLEAAARKLGHKLNYSSPTSSRHKEPSQEQKKLTAKARRAAVDVLMAKVNRFDFKKHSMAVWRSLASSLLFVVEAGDGHELILPALGIEAGKKTNEYQVLSKQAPLVLGKLKTVAEIQRFMALLLVGDELAGCLGEYGGPFTQRDYDLANAFGIDLKALETKALKELTPKKPAKAKAKRAGKIKLTAKPKALTAGARRKSKAAAAGAG